MYIKVLILVISYIFSGMPTVVKTNILIRSMGPVSELDMVSFGTFIRKDIALNLFFLMSFLQSHIR